MNLRLLDIRELTEVNIPPATPTCLYRDLQRGLSGVS